MDLFAATAVIADCCTMIVYIALLDACPVTTSNRHWHTQLVVCITVRRSVIVVSAHALLQLQSFNSLTCSLNSNMEVVWYVYAERKGSVQLIIMHSLAPLKSPFLLCRNCGSARNMKLNFWKNWFAGRNVQMVGNTLWKRSQCCLAIT